MGKGGGGLLHPLDNSRGERCQDFQRNFRSARGKGAGNVDRMRRAVGLDLLANRGREESGAGIVNLPPISHIVRLGDLCADRIHPIVQIDGIIALDWVAIHIDGDAILDGR